MRKVIYTVLCLVILQQAVSAYNREKAVDYAARWANSAQSPYGKKGYNAEQYKTRDPDCANFVSQCLLAGELDLNRGPGYYTPDPTKKPTIPNVADLHTHLTYQHVTTTNR